ncbi:cytochrome b [Achromobacter sp. ESBL13]|uniref:cytochrome b n=1 Tax=Achromobacter sp. ESBL13 TaxID=3077328 RepID=UPI002FC6A8EF
MHSPPAALATQAYTTSQIALHWLSVSLMGILILAGELRHVLTAQTGVSMRSVMIVHIGCGMALLVVTMVRTVVRITRRRAAGADFCMQDACAHAVHLSIYAFIFASCMVGWVVVNAKGLAVPLPFTNLEFPRLVAADPALVVTTVWMHDMLTWGLYGLLALHIVAALAHHFIVRDDTLARMAWRRRQRSHAVVVPVRAARNRAAASRSTAGVHFSKN